MCYCNAGLLVTRRYVLTSVNLKYSLAKLFVYASLHTKASTCAIRTHVFDVNPYFEARCLQSVSYLKCDRFVTPAVTNHYVCIVFFGFCC